MQTKNFTQNLSITFPNNILNCFGIQPILVKDGKIEYSFLGFVYRVANLVNRGGKIHNLIKSRKFEENDSIIKNSFHISEAEYNIVNTILNNSFTLKVNKSLDKLLENKNELKETFYYFLKRIEYYIAIGSGNFIITSRKELYNSRLFTASEIPNMQMFLVNEKILDKNVVIIGHKNNISFCSPYVSSPLIDKTKFENLCSLNDIKIDDFKIDSSLKYPMTEKYLNLYSLYQSYLDNVHVPYWYIETFGQPTLSRQKAYYTTLFFD